MHFNFYTEYDHDTSSYQNETNKVSYHADLVLAVSFLQFVFSKSSSYKEENNCFL